MLGLYSRNRYFQIAAVIAAGLVAAHFVQAITLGNGALRTPILADALSTLAAGLGMVSLFAAARASLPQSKVIFQGWLCLAGAFLFYTLGNAVWMFLGVTQGRASLISVADIAYLLAVSHFIFGAFLLYSERQSPRERVHFWIDAAIALLVVALAYWIFVLTPLQIGQKEIDPTTEFFAIFYPALDLTLFFLFLRLFLERSHKRASIPLILILAAAAIHGTADIALSVQAIRGAYAPGGLLDTLFVVAACLVGLAGVTQFIDARAGGVTEAHSGKAPPRLSFRWFHLIPFVCVVAAYALLAMHDTLALPIGFHDLAIITGAIILLFLVRQIIVVVDYEHLYAAAQREIAERARAEQLLRANEARLRHITDNMFDVVTEIDVTGTILYASPSHQWVLGYDAASLLGHSILDRLHPDDANPALTALIEAISGGAASAQVTFRYRHNDGHYVWMECIGKMLSDAQDQVSGLMLSSRDVTARQQAEEGLRQAKADLELRVRERTAELARAEARLQHLLSASPVVIYSAQAHDDQHTQFISGNIAAMFGYTADQFTRRPGFWLDHIHPDDVARVTEVARLYQTGEDVFEYRFQHADGSYRWVRDAARLIRDHAGNPQEIVGAWMDVTDQKQAEQDLYIKDTAIASSINGIALSDLFGNLTYVNPACLALWGTTREEVIGKNAVHFWHTPDAMLQVLETLPLRGFWEGELVGRKKDGAQFTAHLTASLVKDAAGKPLCLIGSFLDVTEQKRAEQALAQSEEKHRALFETMAQGVVYQDAAGQIISANPAAERILGLTLDQMQGRTSIDPRWRAIHEDGSDFPGDTHPAMVALRTGKDVDNVVMGVYNPSQETYRWINIHATPQFRRGETAPYQVYTTFEDITDLRRAEEELRKLSRAVEQSPAAIVITNPAGDIEYVNPRFLALTGYQFDEVIGKNPRVLKSGLTPPDTYPRLWSTITSGGEWQGEFVNRKKNGELYYELATISPITDAQGKITHFVAVKEDITERKRTEQALTRHATEMATLYETSLEVNAQTELASLLQTIVRRAAGLLHAQYGMLYLIEPDGKTLKVVVGHNLPSLAPIGSTLPLGQGVTGQAAQTGEPCAIQDYQHWENRVPWHPDIQIERIAAIPLKTQGQVTGVITLADSQSREHFTAEDIRLAQLFAEQAALALEKARLHNQIQQLAITDELAGVSNRRGLFQFGEREFERARRHHHPLSAVFFDIDRFKHVNDTHTHAIGDQVLRALAQHAQQNIRHLDILGRYGGEEFVWLLPETDLAHATRVAERLRKSVARMVVSVNGLRLRITISLGLAQVTSHTADLQALIDRADRAMLRAKAAGRNCVYALK